VNGYVLNVKKKKLHTMSMKKHSKWIKILVRLVMHKKIIWNL